MKSDNLERVEAIFREVLTVPPDLDLRAVGQESDVGWDSLGHVTLMTAIEGEFGLTLDTSEMIELTSFAAIERFLEEKGL
jgi:acyl carrier protein